MSFLVLNGGLYYTNTQPMEATVPISSGKHVLHSTDKFLDIDLASLSDHRFADDVPIFIFVSVSRNNSFQILRVKIGSLFEMMTDGSPCSLYTTSRNLSATISAVNGCDKGMKCPYFVSLSMITRIQSNFPKRG